MGISLSVISNSQTTSSGFFKNIEFLHWVLGGFEKVSQQVASWVLAVLCFCPVIFSPHHSTVRPVLTSQHFGQGNKEIDWQSGTFLLETFYYQPGVREGEREAECWPLDLTSWHTAGERHSKLGYQDLSSWGVTQSLGIFKYRPVWQRDGRCERWPIIGGKYLADYFR